MSTDPIDEASQQTRQVLIAISEVIRQLAARRTRRDEEHTRAAAHAIQTKPARSRSQLGPLDGPTLGPDRARHLRAHR